MTVDPRLSLFSLRLFTGPYPERHLHMRDSKTLAILTVELERERAIHDVTATDHC